MHLGRLRFFFRGATAVLEHVDIALVLSAHQLLKRHRTQKTENVGVQIRPQLMRHATLVVLAVFLATALGCVDRLVDSGDDVGDGNAVRRTREVVAAAWAAHAFDQSVTAQLAKKLLQVRKRNLLPIRNTGQGHRPAAVVHSDIDHGGDSKTSLSSQSHSYALASAGPPPAS